MSSTVDGVSENSNETPCFRKECCRSKTKPFNINHQIHDDIIKFVYSAAYTRTCLNCSVISFVCKVCDEHYPSNNANTYTGSVMRHMMIHFGILNNVQHNYFYINPVNQPDGDIDCDAIPTTPLETNIVGANYIEILKYFPHIIFLSKTNYRKLFAEVAKKYDLRKYLNAHGGVSYQYIEGESRDYLIQLIQNGHGAVY